MEYELSVKKRSEYGTDAARRLRRNGWVPGVVYGRGREPEPVVVEERALRSLLSHHGRGLVGLRLDDSEPLSVLIQAVDWHPITRLPLNVDFRAVSLTETIHTRVPVTLVGDPEGIRLGGILEHLLREVEVSCLPTQIPERLELDIASLQIGHSLHVSDLTAPPGAEIVTPRDETVVLLATPTVVEEKVAEVVPAEGAEAAPAEGAEAAPSPESSE